MYYVISTFNWSEQFFGTYEECEEYIAEMTRLAPGLQDDLTIWDSDLWENR